ncbi:MAG: S-methyl-5-thioribose-1-phosphate isomerase, partial [Gaiellaceae bacterium]
AIAKLAIRGAPAIGVAAAMGLALAAINGEDLDEAERVLAASRPTAVNLAWALREVKRDSLHPRDLVHNAHRIHADEVARCKQMSEHAAARFPADAVVLTHCNTGALATAGHGTALGAIRTAHALGKVRHVYVDETRPLLQGSRLTAWELSHAGIPHSVIVDGAAATTIAGSGVTNVVVGADRIAANGDTANKVGTYALAVVCNRHDVPFDVIAPTSTVDGDARTGAAIPIEERPSAEVTDVSTAYNPAFDVTPAELISAIITEVGVHEAPFERPLADAVLTAASLSV